MREHKLDCELHDCGCGYEIVEVEAFKTPLPRRFRLANAKPYTEQECEDQKTGRRDIWDRFIDVLERGIPPDWTEGSTDAFDGARGTLDPPLFIPSPHQADEARHRRVAEADPERQRHQPDR